LGGDSVEVVVVDPEAADTAPVPHPINLNERTGISCVGGESKPTYARWTVARTNVSLDGR
jgi:hypothetical protein